MNGPLLGLCNGCGFGYADLAGHSEEECVKVKGYSANPCSECGHGRYWHEDGFCVQAIAGHGDILPSFCGIHDFKGAE